MLERNKTMAALRETKGGPLAEKELEDAHAVFLERWLAMDNHDVYIEAYQEWRREPKEEGTNMQEYRPTWAGGTASTPVSASELFEHAKRSGRATVDEVADTSGEQVFIASDDSIDYHDYSNINLFGIGRWARNVSRSLVDNVREFDFLEMGLHNYLVHVGKEKADEGDLMLCVEGDGCVFGGPRKRRCMFFVTGVCYCPKVFDVTRLSFEFEEHAISDGLELPFRNYISTRPCRVTNRFDAIADSTSDELIYDMTRTLRTFDL